MVKRRTRLRKRLRRRTRRQRGGNDELLQHLTHRTNKDAKEINGIPLSIYTAWHSLSVRPRMKASVDKMIAMSPEFDVSIFDEDTSKAYIKEHFDKDVLHAYETIIPRAYKADLWRYCILYKHGGIYIDIKCHPITPFIDVVKEHGEAFCRDTVSTSDSCPSKLGVWNGFMIAKPGNAIVKAALDAIVANCKAKEKTQHPLLFSGPCLLGKIIQESGDKTMVKFTTVQDSKEGDQNRIKVVHQEKELITQYAGYRDDRDTHGDTHHIFSWGSDKLFVQ